MGISSVALHCVRLGLLHWRVGLGQSRLHRRVTWRVVFEELRFHSVVKVGVCALVLFLSLYSG